MCTRSSEVLGKIEDNLFASDDIGCDSRWSVSNWVLKSAQVKKEFKKRTSGSSYQNVDLFILQSLSSASISHLTWKRSRSLASN